MTGEDTDRDRGFLVVGLGASAGGLEALEGFCSSIPAAPGMAFVVVTHQRAGHESVLAELLGRKTTLPVIEVSTDTRVEPDHVYLCSPGRALEVVDGVLRSSEVPANHHGLPIDRFFRSLARDRGHWSAAIILSGTGSDGTLGAKDIKAHLGLVIVQDETARYESMPHSVIAGRIADYVLPVHEMPERLAQYAISLGSASIDTPESLRPVFDIIQARTGHDFAHYKESTVRRRVARRMALKHLARVEDYMAELRDDRAEVHHLFHELLIGVTSFFRDPLAWDALVRELKAQFVDKPSDHIVRAWIPGCSTGEEAYSLAITIREVLEALGRPLTAQLFATDLDSGAIDVARAGVYPPGITADVSAERLSRFFVSAEGGGFRVRKDVREMVVFAPQNVIGDPPFTKLDILSCRNLLIYFDSELQRRLLPVFHYALRRDGLMFLGSSESLGTSHELFTPLDKRWKIFRREEVPPGTYAAELPGATTGTYAGVATEPLAAAHRRSAFDRVASQTLLRELVPPTLLVRERGDVVYVHGRTGQFLEPSPGAPSTANVFNMVREGLAVSLAAAIRRAVATGEEVVRRGITVKSDSGHVAVDLRVAQLREPDALEGMIRVSFALAPEGAEIADMVDPPPEQVVDLERELRYARDQHQGTIGELETANEELKSTNEELQSTNEELQSANEELETSKEEMQSLNEELHTVNAELQRKVELLSQANDDMKNLLNGTDIATVFLDSNLNVKRFTEQARSVIRLIPSDVGRPFGDLASSLQYEDLVADCREVLRTLVPKEIHVKDTSNTSYLTRVLPYRTTENVIDGLVLTFVNVSAIARLRDDWIRLEDTLERSGVAALGYDDQLAITWACGAFGAEADELVGRTDHDLFERPEADALVELEREALESGTARRAHVELTVQGHRRSHDVRVSPAAEGDGARGVSMVAIAVEDWGGTGHDSTS